MVSRKMVVHSKSTHSLKPWLSMIMHGFHMDGWLFHARLYAPTIGYFSRIKILCRPYTPQKFSGWDYKLRTPIPSPCQCKYMHPKRSHTHAKDTVFHVRVWWIMEPLTNQACTVGWVAQLCCSWLFPGKMTQISHGRNPHGTTEL